MATARILSDREAADLLRLKVIRLRRLVRARKVPCIELPGGEFRFDEADLLRWLESRKREAQQA